MNRNLFIGVFLIVALVAGGFSYWRSGQAEKVPPPGQDPGNRDEAAKALPAPDFTLPTLDGETVTLSELRGKPVFINFWTTWCPYCVREMPDLQEFYSRYRQEVHMAVINITAEEKSLDDVRNFLAAGGYTFPVLLDTDGDVARRYLVRSIPTSFFLDAQGVLRYYYPGPVALETLEEALKALR
ncbi:MAG TPA: peroxiredoxin [Peptococcaceae bacterium]|nr:MAG: Alkyl hydroperoxide reductase/ Thiol specific antioxidant/ Mal allergen [Moorella sp. 60_41]HBT47034.1 peroxiredoxin [Peptococcaceae bacterium]